MQGTDLHVARDLIQARLLGAIFSKSLKNELVLKGGLAMRVMAASTRYTKDIDLESPPSVPARFVRNCIRKAIDDLRQSGFAGEVSYSEPKQTETTLRWKIGATVGSQDVSLTVEVSRRDMLDPNDVHRVPYGTEAAPVTSVGLPSLAAAKLDCIGSPNREAPRDIYDLYVLVGMDIRPTAEALAAFGREKLETIRDTVWHKLEKMDYNAFLQELSGYLAAEEAERITPEIWDEMRLVVGTAVTEWTDEGIAQNGAANEDQEDDTLARSAP